MYLDNIVSERIKSENVTYDTKHTEPAVHQSVGHRTERQRERETSKESGAFSSSNGKV